jgi:hypothetical protein
MELWLRCCEKLALVELHHGDDARYCDVQGSLKWNLKTIDRLKQRFGWVRQRSTERKTYVVKRFSGKDFYSFTKWFLW